MKKLILIFLGLCTLTFSYAQSDKYMDAMKKNISILDSMIYTGNATDVINSFLRIGDAEKTQWLPYYYAAYATATLAARDQDVSNKDAQAEKATDYLAKAEAALGKENSEIALVKAIIATAQMTVDPQSRFMTYGPLIGAAIERAKKLDPTNPRPYLIEAQNTFYTPEQFGGGSKVAKPIFDKAAGLFISFTPETPLSPQLGQGESGLFYDTIQINTIQ